LEERLAFAVAQGVREELVCLDPGIGFGKTPEHNLELVRRLDELLAIGRPVLIGFSRKSTLGKLMGDPDARVGTTAASVGIAVAAVREVNERRFELLEALASTVAETLMERFAVANVKVRVRKRPAGMPVEFSAVTAERP